MNVRPGSRWMAPQPVDRNSVSNNRSFPIQENLAPPNSQLLQPPNHVNDMPPPNIPNRSRFGLNNPSTEMHPRFAVRPRNPVAINTFPSPMQIPMAGLQAQAMQPPPPRPSQSRSQFPPIGPPPPRTFERHMLPQSQCPPAVQDSFIVEARDFHFQQPQLSNPGSMLQQPQMSNLRPMLQQPQLSTPEPKLQQPQLSNQRPMQQQPQLSNSMLQQPQLSNPRFMLQQPQLSNPGSMLQQPQLTNPGSMLQQPQLTNPGSMLQQPQLSNPGSMLQQPQLSNPGSMLQQPQLFNPGPMLRQPRLSSPGIVLQHSQITNQGPMLQQPQISNSGPVLPIQQPQNHGQNFPVNVNNNQFLASSIGLPHNFNTHDEPPDFGFKATTVDSQANTNLTLNKNVVSTEESDKESQPSFDKYQREKDQSWVHNWLKKIGRTKSFLEQKKMDKKQNKGHTIPDVQKAFHESIVLLARLQQQCNSLESQLGVDQHVWEAEKNLTEEYKEKCVEVHEYLSGDDMLTEIQRKLKLRKRKRERLKKQRKEAYESEKAAKEKRDMENQQINEWMEKMKQQVEDEKQKEELKKSADMTLSAVRKKISDAKKTQEFLKAFQKLRKIRRTAAISQGRYASNVYDENFEKAMRECSELMETQLKVYEIEEKTLKVMLEEAEEETIEREKEIKREKEAAKQKRELRLAMEKLFGKKADVSEDNELFPFFSFYNQAKESVDGLVQIRHDWDMHLVPLTVPAGSRIPDGWVVPTEPSSETWATALKESE